MAITIMPLIEYYADFVRLLQDTKAAPVTGKTFDQMSTLEKSQMTA